MVLRPAYFKVMRPVCLDPGPTFISQNISFKSTAPYSQRLKSNAWFHGRSMQTIGRLSAVDQLQGYFVHTKQPPPPVHHHMVPHVCY